jgi:hypothetical protein
MKKSVFLATLFLFGFFSFAAKKASDPVNEKCPISDKAIDPAQNASFNVCCSKCLKKAKSDLKGFVSKTKAGNKECPFSGKPAKKKVVVGFCCSKCKGKASS